MSYFIHHRSNEHDRCQVDAYVSFCNCADSQLNHLTLSLQTTRRDFVLTKEGKDKRDKKHVAGKHKEDVGEQTG